MICWFPVWPSSEISMNGNPISISTVVLLFRSSCLAEESFCIIYGLQSEKFGNSDYKGPVLIILEGISQSVLHSDKISIESAESRNRVPKSQPVADEFHFVSRQNLRSDMVCFRHSFLKQ